MTTGKKKIRTCLMGYCEATNSNKDICDLCYYRFKGELGVKMSQVVRFMIKRAVERNKYEVKITKEDIYNVWSEDNKCPILHTIYKIGNEDYDTSPSLDRIDPRLGYTPDNIQIISSLANRMKNNATDEQLLKFSHYYIEYYRKWYESNVVN